MEPVWGPLEKQLGAARCVGFMFMGNTNGINCYKHGITRIYFNLDDAGNCYLPGAGGVYVPVDLDTEINKLETCLAAIGFALTTPYDEDFIATKRKALQDQGVSLLIITVEPHKTNIH